MIDPRPRSVHPDRNDIEAAILLFDLVFKEVSLCDPADLLLLLWRDGIFGIAKLVAMPCFHFAEDKHITITSDDIDFAMTEVVVHLDDLETVLTKMLHGKDLTAITGGFCARLLPNPARRFRIQVRAAI